MRDNDSDMLLPDFTPAHYARLCENEYFRYIPNSDVIGHVLLDHRGQATQYALPDHTQNLAAPLVGELRELTQFNLPNNKTTLLGFLGETQMISRRAYSISLAYEQEDPISYTFYPLSPKKNPVTQEDRSVIYDTEPVVRFQDTDEVRAEIARIPKRTKTGAELKINNEHIPIRMLQRRAPDQNTVMGRHSLEKARRAIRRQRDEEGEVPVPRTASRSAVVEMTEFLDHYREILTGDMIRILEGSVNAPFNSSQAGQARGEWLHREAHNLHPITLDPQRADNLGAAEKRYNTEMMIGERTVQFFALNVPHSRSAIKSDFEMLLDSEVIDMIHFVSCIQVAGFTIKITQHIDAFQREPQCVKASDLAGLVSILFFLIRRQAPRSVQSISIGRTNATIFRFQGNFSLVKQENESIREDSEERLLLQ